jgi:hypothetical protein
MHRTNLLAAALGIIILSTLRAEAACSMGLCDITVTTGQWSTAATERQQRLTQEWEAFFRNNPELEAKANACFKIKPLDVCKDELAKDFRAKVAAQRAKARDEAWAAASPALIQFGLNLLAAGQPRPPTIEDRLNDLEADRDRLQAETDRLRNCVDSGSC